MMVTDVNRGVIFDLDGVLVDTGWAHKQSWRMRYRESMPEKQQGCELWQLRLHETEQTWQKQIS